MEGLSIFFISFFSVLPLSPLGKNGAFVFFAYNPFRKPVFQPKKCSKSSRFRAGTHLAAAMISPSCRAACSTWLFTRR